MKILCATDFSAGGETAARMAIDLADRTDGTLELMHVVPPPAFVLPIQGEAEATIEGEEQARGQAEVALSAAVRALRMASLVPVAAHLEAGVVEDCLLERATRTAADLLVMGTHGRTGVDRWLMGSASERVVRRSAGPVLIVPPGASPLTGGGHGGLKVLVAFDGRASSEATLAFVRRLRLHGPCDVVVLQLYWPPEEYRRLGLTGARELYRTDPEVARDLEASARRRIGELPGPGGVELVIEASWGSPATAILAAARAHGCGLVVMGAESRHGLARVAHVPVAEGTLRQSPDLPILFVPPAPPTTPAIIPRMDTVLAATDLSPAGDEAARAAYALLAERGGVVELCHVHERPLATPAYAYDEPAGRLSEAARHSIEARLRALIPADAPYLGITTHVVVVDGGEAATALVQAAERLRVDALVLGAGKHGGARRGLLGSVSQAVARASQRPVLLIPTPRSDR
ncbi:MAG TPA: universal stress protein [Polyangia bacterium]|jgi:nucleotide-binding universal stress UspA family protein